MLAMKKKQEVARPLNVLVPLIKEELEAGEQAGMAHYRKAGEMLLEAKEQVKHGEWTNWVASNFHLSRTTAQVYMRWARVSEALDNTNDSGKKLASNAFRTLSEVYGDYRENHTPVWSKPVIQAMDDPALIERIRQNTQSRSDEAKLTRQLALKLIDIGYKVLATQLHPDKGGSKEAMARLNRVRDQLKKYI